MKQTLTFLLLFSLAFLLLFSLAVEASALSGVLVAGNKKLNRGECLEVGCDDGIVKSLELVMSVGNAWRRSATDQPLCRVSLLSADSVELQAVEIMLGRIRNADDDDSRRFVLTFPGCDRSPVETEVEASAGTCTLQLTSEGNSDWETRFGYDSYIPAGTIAGLANVAAVRVKALLPAEVISVNLDSRPLPEARDTRWQCADDVERYLAEAPYDMVEGVYTYMDCDLDTRRARRGGDYRIAVVKAGTGYDLIYLGGAEVNAGDWREGMRKGHVEPTVFQDNYTLRWADANGDAGFEGAWASITGAIMELHFPAESATLRFSREP